MYGRLVALVAITAASVALAIAPDARASTGAGAQANCERLETTTRVYHWIQVTAPRLDATHNMIVYPGGWLVSNPLQWVKYRAHLYRYQSGRWTKIASSPFYRTQVSTASVSGAWYNEALGRWVRGDHRFDIATVGGWAYRVAAEYVWLPFYGDVGYAYAPEAWVPHIDDRRGAYYLSQVPYCVY